MEICKLRLFLKLVAQVESAEHIEPLPDIDFNVRAGNTLVGFASLTELEALQKSPSGFDAEEATAILDRAKEAEKAFAAFRRLHVQFGAAALDSGGEKGVESEAGEPAESAGPLPGGEYGVDADKPEGFTAWRDSHRPFHWLAEYYGIMSDGGFAVIIGNPPYVEYSKVRGEYQVLGLDTLVCGNLYGCASSGATTSSGRQGDLASSSKLLSCPPRECQRPAVSRARIRTSCATPRSTIGRRSCSMECTTAASQSCFPGRAPTAG